jgi:hypothetical protein
MGMVMPPVSLHCALLFALHQLVPPKRRPEERRRDDSHDRFRTVLRTQSRPSIVRKLQRFGNIMMRCIIRFANISIEGSHVCLYSWSASLLAAGVADEGKKRCLEKRERKGDERRKP